MNKFDGMKRVFDPLRRDLGRIARALGRGEPEPDSEIGKQLRQATQGFERRGFYITEKGTMAMQVLGSYKHEPPTLITYTEILKTLAAPLTPEEAGSIQEAAQSLGIETDLTVMKATGEQAVTKINRTILDLIADGLLLKVDNVTYQIQGLGSKAERSFALFMTLTFQGADSPSHAMPAGALFLETSRRATGELREISPDIASTLRFLTKRGYVGQASV